MKKFLFLLSVFFLVSCRPNVLGYSQSGKTLKYRLGESFEIVLPENNTTGYRWEFKTDPESQLIISLVSDDFIPSKTKSLGAGGNRVIKYQAADIGSVRLEGYHIRAFQSDMLSAEPNVTYDIIVY